MKRSLVILFLVLFILCLFLFTNIFFGFSPAQNNTDIVQSSSNILPKNIEQKLKQQAINQFYSLVDYDLDALDAYAPTYEEMEKFYQIFDENAFQEKYNFFAKNYATQGMNFGEDAFYDRDLIMRIGSRASVLRARSNILNSEQIRLGDDPIKIDTVYVQPNESVNDMYNLHVRFYHSKSESYYEFANETCWLTERTCITTLGWKFLGRYNKHTRQYSFSQLNSKNI